MTYSPFPFEQFGSLDLVEAPDEVGGGLDLLNVEFDKRGALRSRDGYAKLTSSAGATRYDSIYSISGPASANVASTKFAGTGADSSAVGTLAWTNPGNITADDGTNATAANASIPVQTHYLKATGFGFAIPAGATVVGIFVEVDKRTSGGSGFAKDAEVKLLKAGVVQTINRAVTGQWSTALSPPVATYGSASDLWGGTWTVADINDANFGAVVSATMDGGLTTARVDFIRITVYYSPSGTNYVLAGASGSRIDAINTSGSVAATVATASDTQHSYAAFGSPATSAVYIGNNGTTIRKYSAGAFSVPAGGPKAKFLALQTPDNRLVAANLAAIPTGAGSTASTSLVHFSDAGAPETWSANNYIYLTPGDNEDIQGVAAWGTMLFVFKSTKFFVFYGNSQDATGNPVFNYRPITSGVGLAAPLAMASSPNGLYFVDRRGLYLTTGGAPQLVSSPLDPLFLGAASSFYQGGTINPSALAQVSLCWFSGRLYMGFPQGSSTTNDRTLVYDPSTQEWTLWDIPMGAMASVNAQPPRLAFTYGQGTNDIGLYAQNAYSDDAGSAILSRYRSGFMAMNYIHRSAHGTWLPITSQEGTVREVVFDGTGSFNFSLSRDFNEAIPTVGGGASSAVTLGTSPAVRQGRYRIAQRGRRISFQIDSTTPWLVESMTWAIRGARAVGLKTPS